MRIFLIQALDDRDLVRGTEETGIDAVQIDALLPPRVQISVQNLGRVMECEHLIARMRGEQRRRDGADIAAGRRQNRNGRGQRALAVAAHVMHRGHAGNVPRISVIQNLIAHISTPLSRLSAPDFSRWRDLGAVLSHDVADGRIDGMWDIGVSRIFACVFSMVAKHGKSMIPTVYKGI